MTTLEKFAAIAGKYIGSYFVETIVECGSHKCEDTVAMAEIFNKAHIYTFECNPATLPLCRERVKDIPRITLVEKALGDIEGEVAFYPINKEKTKTTWEDGNQGASSRFIASGKYPVEEYHQDEIVVQATTLANYPTPDLMWLDAQGSELSILQGMGDKLKDVKIIQAEVNFEEQYTGQPMYHEVKMFLEDNGFVFIGFHDEWEWCADAYFVNKCLIT